MCLCSKDSCSYGSAGSENPPPRRTLGKGVDDFFERKKIRLGTPMLLSLVLPLLLLIPDTNLLGPFLPRHASMGDKSVYVPGAGFSGFWYHLGLFQSMTKETLYEYDYYCYSSACLSLILGFLQTPVEDAYHTCQAIQQEWYRGELSTHNMVDEFLRRLVVPFLEGDDNNQQMTSRPRPPASWLSRIHIMSTNLATGVEIQQATNRDELVQLIKQTTWIPFLTGQDWRLLLDNGEHNNSNTFMAAGYLDGYFSIPLHPPCRYTARVPFSPGMYLHSLNPALGQNQVFEFVRYGQGQVNNPFELNNRWNTTTG